MILEHYSAEPLTEIRSAFQLPGNTPRYKPEGIWVSVPGDDDWPTWCREQQYELSELRHKTLLTLSDAHNVLIINTAEGVDDFHRNFADFEQGYIRLINWTSVAGRYDGIIIAPYQRACRKGRPASGWYDTWDCASGCIWNADALRILGPIGDADTGLLEVDGK